MSRQLRPKHPVHTNSLDCLALKPSLEIRIEAAKALYVEIFRQVAAERESGSPDFNRWADFSYRALLAMYGEVDPSLPYGGRYPGELTNTAFGLFSFLEANGVNGHELVAAD